MIFLKNFLNVAIGFTVATGLCLSGPSYAQSANQRAAAERAKQFNKNRNVKSPDQRSADLEKQLLKRDKDRLAACVVMNDRIKAKLNSYHPGLTENILQLSNGFFRKDDTKLLVITLVSDNEINYLNEIKSISGILEAESNVYYKYQENYSPANVANNGVVEKFEITALLNIKKSSSKSVISRGIVYYNQGFDPPASAWRDGYAERISSVEMQPRHLDVDLCGDYWAVDHSIELFYISFVKYADGYLAFERQTGIPFDNNTIQKIFQDHVLNSVGGNKLFSNPLNCPSELQSQIGSVSPCKIGWYLTKDPVSVNPDAAAQARRNASVGTVANADVRATGDVFEDGYTYGYKSWEAKSYPESRAALEEILTKFPQHKRASYARNLLGRAWLDDKKPATAANVFYNNYKSDPRGDRAPDSLFFLGSALSDLGKIAEACEAFGELERAYPEAATGRLAEGMASAKVLAKCR